MKDIKIKLMGTTDYLGKKYDAKRFFSDLNLDMFYFIDSNEPDYIIHHGALDEGWINYNGIRISMESEICIPDFNVSDYAMSTYPIDFEDRHLTVPVLVRPDCYEIIKNMDICPREFTAADLEKKDKFCNFIYSNAILSRKRVELFELLSTYKFVHSGGKLLNNIGGPIPGGIGDYRDKLEFQAHCKFTIAAENIEAINGATEKLAQAFQANTIPIYWGDKAANKIFNEKAFINCHNFSSNEELLSEIIRLDNDDDAYLEMLNQPIFAPEFNLNVCLEEQKRFFENIFSQEKENAYRRPRVGHSYWLEQTLAHGIKIRKRNQRIQHQGKRCLGKIGMNRLIDIAKRKLLANNDL